MPAPTHAPILAGIAKRYLDIDTLETRNAGHLDFYDLAVWAIRAALEDAFQAGRAAGPEPVSLPRRHFEAGDNQVRSSQRSHRRRQP